ncbi:MAG: hypothetical protein ACTS2F_09520 [Thainema sp.]
MEIPLRSKAKLPIDQPGYGEFAQVEHGTASHTAKPYCQDVKVAIAKSHLFRIAIAIC